MRKSQLDLRICDCEESATNPQTYREFIVMAEDEIYGNHECLDRKSDDELNEYLDRLDYLMDK